MGNIWGMILLGAIGSVLGTICVFIAVRVFRILFPKLVSKFKDVLKKIVSWLIKGSVNDHLMFFFRSSPSKLQAYYSTLIAKLIACLFLVSWLLYFTFTSYTSGRIWITISLIAAITLILVISLKIYITIAAAWLLDIDSKVDKAANKAIEDAAKEAVGKALSEFVSETPEKSNKDTANIR